MSGVIDEAAPLGEADPAALAGVEVPEAVKRQRRSWGLAFWLAAGWLCLVLFCALFADWLPLKSPVDPAVRNKLSPPTTENWLGTDNLGRDILSRLIHGARVSVIISLSAVGIGGVIGGLLGMTVGYFRGAIETVVMRLIDIILAFPAIVLLLAMINAKGQNLPVICLTIGFLSIPIYTRVARANTMTVVEREYVRTARTIGAGHGRVLFREVLPNVLPSVLAYALVAMGVVVVLEGSLAFLGLSVPMPRPTWGGMIFEAKRVLRDDPMVSAIPAFTMFLTVLSLNFVGDALRSRFDVKEARL